MPVTREGSGETQLYFKSTGRDDPAMSSILNPRDSMVVAVKQVLVLEPALQYVLEDAYKDIFGLFGNYRANDTYREVAPSHN